MNECAAELAADAVIPEHLAALMAHVVTNLVAHAAWVGSATPEARAEHDALLAVAGEYRAIAAAASRAAERMRAMRDLRAAPHDPAALDRETFGAWMRRKVVLQLQLAKLLLEHAAASEEVFAGSAR